MAYARTNYTLKDIELGFRTIDTNVTQGNVGGMAVTQPKPHSSIHGGDELHSHPLFAKARVTTGDATTHSVMDQLQMQTELVGVFNDPNMQPFLANVDHGQDQGVNINLTNSPGNAEVFKQTKGGVTQNNWAVVAFFVKIRPNPNNKDIPIIQTCVPRTTPYNPGDLVTKKGVVKGFTH